MNTLLEKHKEEGWHISHAEDIGYGTITKFLKRGTREIKIARSRVPYLLTMLNILNIIREDK